MRTRALVDGAMGSIDSAISFPSELLQHSTDQCIVPFVEGHQLLMGHLAGLLHDPPLEGAPAMLCSRKKDGEEDEKTKKRSG